MAIKSVDEFAEEATKKPPERPYVRERSADEYEDPVYWGPASSLDAGDAASRLGIDMGEPRIKAALFREMLETRDASALVKEAWIMSGAIRGAGALAKGLGKAVGFGARGAGKAVGAGAKGLSRLGKRSRQFFAGRRAAQQPATTAGGKVMSAGGKAFDTADVGFMGAAASAPLAGYAMRDTQTLGGFF